MQSLDLRVPCPVGTSQGTPAAGIRFLELQLLRKWRDALGSF